VPAHYTNGEQDRYTLIEQPPALIMVNQESIFLKMVFIHMHKFLIYVLIFGTNLGNNLGIINDSGAKQNYRWIKKE